MPHLVWKQSGSILEASWQQDGSKMGWQQDGSKMAARWQQDGSKMAARWQQDDSKVIAKGSTWIHVFVSKRSTSRGTQYP